MSPLSFHSSKRRFRRSGYWLVLGRHRVFLEPSPFADALAARAQAEQVREQVRLLRAAPRPWL